MQGKQELSQSFGIEISVYLTILSHCNRACLLRYNNGYAVRHFTDTDTCSVSCAKFLVDVVICREGKIAGCSLNPVISDYDGTIMKRRIMLKYIHQKLVGNYGVNTDTCINEILERYLILDNNKCTCPGSGKGRGGLNYLIDSLVGKSVRVFRIPYTQITGQLLLT